VILNLPKGEKFETRELVRVNDKENAMKAILQNWENVKLEQLSPLVARRYVHGEQAMVASFELKAGAVVPWHEHANEQISILLDGRVRFLFKTGNEEYALEAVSGDTVVIPGHVPHCVAALEDSRAFDVFAPPREDWIAGDDAYLRNPPNLEKPV
jgi:quercetin dioxygenase-like cupin family protein